MHLYDIEVSAMDGKPVQLSAFRSKVLLIVNTATHCGFTPQYDELQKLYKQYKEKGFEILDFPCNQFLGQAPGTNEEIASFCQLNYGVTFKTFAKINVNGDNAEPLYKYLKENSKGALGSAIKWNFTKFLISRNGEVAGRFAPTVEPEQLKKEIEVLL